MAKNQVTLTFAGDIKDLQSKFSKIGNEGDKLDRSLSGASNRIVNSLGGIAKKAAIVGGALAAVGAGAAIALGRSLLSTAEDASDLNEAMSKVDTVFGSSAASIHAWASDAATALGLSKKDAEDAAGSFGNMFDQLGLGGQTAVDMSKDIVGLASDFASFHNADITDVIDAQSAAFRGEYDSLQRFLPLINAAAVETRALELSGKANKDQLTAQDKALAVHALMLEGAGDAQGDFARTSDGMANQTRIAEAQIANMRAEVGQKMLPITQKLTEWKLKLAGALADRLGPAIEKVTTWFSDNRTTFEAIGNTITTVVLPAIGNIISTVGTALYNAVAWLVEHKDTWIAIGEAILSVAVPAFQTIATWIQAVAANKDLLLAIGIGVLAVMVPAFVSWAISAGAAAIATLAAIAPLLLVGAIVAAVAYLIIHNWDWIKEKTLAVWNFVKTNTVNAFNSVKSIVSSVFGRIKSIITTHIDAFKATFRAFKTVVTSIFRTLSTAMTSPFRTAFRAIKRLWNSSIGGFSFSVPSWIPVVGGKGFTIPSMAEGGIATGPTLAYIGEGGESEAVIPLSKLEGMMGSSGTTTLVIDSRGSRLDDLLLEVLLRSASTRGLKLAAA